MSLRVALVNRGAPAAACMMTAAQHKKGISKHRKVAKES